MMQRHSLDLWGQVIIPGNTENQHDHQNSHSGSTSAVAAGLRGELILPEYGSRFTADSNPRRGRPLPHTNGATTLLASAGQTLPQQMTLR